MTSRLRVGVMAARSDGAGMKAAVDVGRMSAETISRFHDGYRGKG